MDKGRREWYDNFPATGDRECSRTSGVDAKNKPSAGGGLKVPTAGPPRAKSESGMRNAAPEPPPPPQEKSRARAKSTGDRDVHPEAE